MRRARLVNPATLRPGDIIESYDGPYVVSSNFDDHIICIDEGVIVKMIHHSKLIKDRFYVYKTPLKLKIERFFDGIITRMFDALFKD